MYPLSSRSLDYVSTAFQQQRKFLLVEEISNQSDNGIEFCAGLFYAEYLGIPLRGRIPFWIQKVRRNPPMASERLVEGIRTLLALKAVKMTDQGFLVSNSHDVLR